MSSLRFCVLCGTIVATTALSAGDWTEFRGPAQGVADASGLPLTWSESEHISWKVLIPGTGWSSPVVKAGRIYLTTAVPDESAEVDGTPPQSLRVLCLDAASGEPIWDVEAFAQSGGDAVEMHQKNSHASPTPVIEGERLYVHFGPHGTACLGLADGEFVWRTQELVYSPNHGTGGSPALAGETLVICCDGRDVQYVAGLDKQSGGMRWKTPRDTEPDKGFSFCTPTIITVSGRVQAICPGSDAVFAYDPQTGEEIWRVRYGSGFSVVPRPVFGQGLVFVCTGFGDGRLLAIDPTGTGDVTDSHVQWTLSRGVPHTPSPLLVGAELYLVDDSGVSTCLAARTGEKHWQKRLGGNFSASPVSAEGRVYFQDEGGSTTVVRVGTDFEELARNELAGDERTFASMAVVDDAILLRSEKHLYRIDE